MIRFILIILAGLHGLTLFGQPSNTLLNRSYWKEKPSLETVQSHISQGNDPSAFDAHKFNPITWAILEEASMDIIFLLLDQDGNSVNLKAHDGRSPIFWAAYKGNVELMSELIKRGARLDLIDDHGVSVVNFAASTGQTKIELFELCANNGIQLNKEETSDGATPLLLVMPYLASPAEIDYFIQKGLKLDHTDHAGNNAFVYAAATGNEVLLTYLKGNGINPRANDNAAMLVACKGTRSKSNKKETFLLLEKLGVSPTAKDNDGNNAFHYLASKCQDTAVFRYFLSRGVDLDQKDIAGNTPLLKAITSNSSEIVQFLINYQADPLSSNSSGENALHIAAKSGNIDIIHALLKTGINIDAATNDGLTTLHIAAMTSKDTELLRTLINAGADKGILTSFDETAYDLALENELIQQKSTTLQFLKP